MKCCICGYKVKSMSDPSKSKRDTLALNIGDLLVCGWCARNIADKVNDR